MNFICKLHPILIVRGAGGYYISGQKIRDRRVIGCCDGDGKLIPAAAIPCTWDRVSLLVNWVEKGVAPGKLEMVTAGEKGLPLCSYPNYPKYVSGAVTAAGSYSCQ